MEFFPPKDAEGENRLWQEIEDLKKYAPDFISVTYGAGGSSRDRTINVTSQITKRTGIDTVAHLTCVGSTKEELKNILREYHSAGIEKILALRGDPQGGPQSPWVQVSNGFNHAVELVELAAATGKFEIGVAAFPDGHPASNGNFDQDIEVLISKAKAGASFATTQFFFSISKYEFLVNELENRNCNLPVIAGILPITNLKQLQRMALLSGAQLPDEIHKRFSGYEEIPEDVKKIGIEIATELGQKLLEINAPGLHFYTMNKISSTIEIARNLNLI